MFFVMNPLISSAPLENLGSEEASFVITGFPVLCNPAGNTNPLLKPDRLQFIALLAKSYLKEKFGLGLRARGCLPLYQAVL